MYATYILQSEKTNKYYIGHTRSINDRVQRHNDGQVKSTKHGVPWKLVWIEKFETKGEAIRRELKIKSYKGGIPFKRLLGLWKEE